MDLGLKDRVALVAGASQGLGKAVAASLAREGAAVAVCSRRSEVIAETAREIAERTGARTCGAACDITDRDAVSSLVRRVVVEFGRLDILVTNAGGPPLGSFDAFDDRAWQGAVELNLLSTVNLTVAAAREMKPRRWGRIINITSIAAKQPMDQFVLSNTVRAGVLGFSKSASNELAGHGITVNTLCPGYTRTERIGEVVEGLRKRHGITEAEAEARIVAEVPMRRMAEPEEFAALATFLASEQAGYITGTVIQVDGGFVRAVV